MTISELLRSLKWNPYYSYGKLEEFIHEFSLEDKNPVGALEYIEEHLQDKSAYLLHGKMEWAKKEILRSIRDRFNDMDALYK